MWAIRRTSNPLKARVFGIRTSSLFRHKSDFNYGKFGETTSLLRVLPGESPYSTRSYEFNTTTSFGNRCLSSQAGAESGREDDELEETFKIESGSAIEESSVEDGNEDEVVSEVGVLDDDDVEDSSKNDLELSDSEIDPIGEKPTRKSDPALYKAIVSAPSEVSFTLHKWFEEGKDLNSDDTTLTISRLRRRHMYGPALQLLEWLKSKNKKKFSDEKDYASQLDLIAKVRGVQNAENFINKIPESYKTEVVYRTLLANICRVNNIKKANETFNKMKELGFSISTFACNQMLSLYKRVDRKKIADILYLMEKEKIKPNQRTYRILITSKSHVKDLKGVDKIVEAMELEGVKFEAQTLELLAGHYASGGFKKKAKAIMKEMEGEQSKPDPSVCRMLIPLYAQTGEADEVRRLWKICGANPSFDDFGAAIEAWGILNEVEEAEAVFEGMVKAGKKPLTRHYLQLLKIYGNKKMLSKGKDLVKQMEDCHCRIDEWVWDAIVRLYADSGELEKADFILQKASLQSKEKMRPLFTTYIYLIDEYAKKGDTYNAEKIFYRMRENGYVSKLKQFRSLIQAYVNARAPAFGMRERLKADNIVPNKSLEGQLVLLDPFRKSKMSHLLN